MKFTAYIDPATIPTAQQKGVRVVKGVPMFYKKKPLIDFERRFTAVVDRARAENGNYRIQKYVPIFLHVAFLFGYPESTPKSRRIDWEPMPLRPDGENLEKAVTDCMGDRFRRVNGKWVMVHEGIFPDDAAITPLVISKFRTTGRPRVLVSVMPRDEWVQGLPKGFLGVS